MCTSSSRLCCIADDGLHVLEPHLVRNWSACVKVQAVGKTRDAEMQRLQAELQRVSAAAAQQEESRTAGGGQHPQRGGAAPDAAGCHYGNPRSPAVRL